MDCVIFICYWIIGKLEKIRKVFQVPSLIKKWLNQVSCILVKKNTIKVGT